MSKVPNTAVFVVSVLVEDEMTEVGKREEPIWGDGVERLIGVSQNHSSESQGNDDGA